MYVCVCGRFETVARQQIRTCEYKRMSSISSVHSLKRHIKEWGLHFVHNLKLGNSETTLPFRFVWMVTLTFHIPKHRRMSKGSHLSSDLGWDAVSCPLDILNHPCPGQVCTGPAFPKPATGKPALAPRRICLAGVLLHGVHVTALKLGKDLRDDHFLSLGCFSSVG